jgi:hypothetical protein
MVQYGGEGAAASPVGRLAMAVSSVRGIGVVWGFVTVGHRGGREAGVGSAAGSGAA